jgi:type IV secretory pathway VirB2 component (pilin)
METALWREYLSSAIRYWEPRRIVYNAVLGVVVLIHIVIAWPASKASLQTDNLLFLFVLAVLANVAYCAAYVVDIVVQMSGFRESWLRLRWILLLIGLAFAATLAHFFAFPMFHHP